MLPYDTIHHRERVAVMAESDIDQWQTSPPTSTTTPENTHAHGYTIEADISSHRGKVSTAGSPRLCAHHPFRLGIRFPVPSNPVAVRRDLTSLIFTTCGRYTYVRHEIRQPAGSTSTAYCTVYIHVRKYMRPPSGRLAQPDISRDPDLSIDTVRLASDVGCAVPALARRTTFGDIRDWSVPHDIFSQACRSRGVRNEIRPFASERTYKNTQRLQHPQRERRNNASAYRCAGVYRSIQRASSHAVDYCATPNHHPLLWPLRRNNCHQSSCYRFGGSRHTIILKTSAYRIRTYGARDP